MKNVRRTSLLAAGLLIAYLMIAGPGVARATGQCLDTPTGETAIIFNNGSSYQVTFFVDWVAMQALPTHTVSREFTIASGPHLLIGQVQTGEETTRWVFSEGNFPAGKVCTWTFTDADVQNTEKKGYGYGG